MSRLTPVNQINDQPEELQQVIDLLSAIRNFRNHPAIVRILNEDDNELVREVVWSDVPPMKLLIDDYLRFHEPDESKDLNDSDKKGLELHARFVALRALAEYQKTIEALRADGKNLLSGVRELDEEAAREARLRRDLDTRMPFEPIPLETTGMPYSSRRPSPFRATIPAGPPPPSIRAPEVPPYDEAKLSPKMMAYAYADEETTVASGTLTGITYGMKGAKIVIENGAKLNLFMVSNDVTIVLKGPDSYVRIQKAGRNCIKIRIVGADGQEMRSGATIELGAGLEEKIA